MNEIKTAADSVFGENPYSEITLTTIAQQLGWSRANLYKYFSNFVLFTLRYSRKFKF